MPEQTSMIETQIPKIPNKGDYFGVWHQKDDNKWYWSIKTVDYIVYEFSKRGKFICVKINLTF